MITPRRTRLIRVPDLRAFHRAIAQHACAGDVADIRSSAVIVSTQAAAEQLRCTLENLLLGAAHEGTGASVWPEIVTRDGWYDQLQAASAGAPRQLSAIEREVLMARAARVAVGAGHRPPFEVRPAIVAEMVRFFDTMLRLGRTLDGFERLATEELEARVPIDRGAAQLLAQTRFLVSSFRAYEKSVTACGSHDEHVLRAHLLAGSDVPPFTRVVVTVGDRSCSAHGLWPSDFDLLARLPHLARIDIVATRNVLAAGFLDRLHDLLPGIEETDFEDAAAPGGADPTLVRPAGSEEPWWVSRDREEEIASIARRIKQATASDVRGPESATARGDSGQRTADIGRRIAVICKRPLPYLYLAQAYFSAAGIPFQAFDDLPLAAEPFAAAVDLVLRFVESGFGRRQGIALLRSPHFVFRSNEGEIGREAVNALETALRESSHEADAGSLETLAARWRSPDASSAERSAVPAAVALAGAARALDPLRCRQSASAQFDLLRGFVAAHAADSQPVAAERSLRARAAVVNALRDLASAHRRHDDPPYDFDETCGRLRRWMESQTFSPQTGRGGVHLVDADAARYGDFDQAYLVGAIEREWPDKEGRTIFYPLSLLNHLGWPPERLRLTAARAAFTDLLRVAGGRVSVSTFVLEDDGLVEPSPFLDELDRAGLREERADPVLDLRIVAEDALSLEPVRTDVLDGAAREWADLRQERSRGTESRYPGTVDRLTVTSIAVSRLDMYLDCPFRYFAEAVLSLQDETDDDPSEGPRAHGKVLHETLAAFYEEWRARRGGTITCANLDEARRVFGGVVERQVASMRPADAMLWRARLLGSAVRAGVAEVVLRAEAAGGEVVVDRLLEHRLDGPCHLTPVRQKSDAGASAADAATPTGRTVHLRAVADRIDLLAGDRFRVIDYKLGRAPDVRRMVQLPLYALRAGEQLRSRGREHARLSDAQYYAFGEREPVVGIGSRAAGIDEAVAEGQGRALDAIDGIERGLFPASPVQAFKCNYCPFALVCRQDYVDG